MNDINPLGNSFLYAGIQNTANELKNQKTEKSEKTKKSSFADILHQNKTQAAFESSGLPSEIQNMTIEDAAVYLRDQFDLAGNEISSNVSTENILKFKKAVSDFLKFIEQNNFDVEIMNRKLRIPQASKQNFFSPFELPPKKQITRIKMQTINQKLDALTRDMLSRQANNLKILAQVDEIKGLIVDLMCS